MKKLLPVSRYRKNALLGKPCVFPESFDLEKYIILQGKPTRLLSDLGYDRPGQAYNTGASHARSLPRTRLFLRAGKGLPFFGDFVYEACLYAFYPSIDPQAFMRSVQRVKTLELSKILPGHHWLDLCFGRLTRASKAFAMAGNCAREMERSNLSISASSFSRWGRLKPRDSNQDCAFVF